MTASRRDRALPQLESGALFQVRTGARRASSEMLLECDLGKASELARMQAFPFLGFELFQRPQADLKMLADPLPVEFAGHTSELDLAVKRLVRDAEQRAVGHAEAKAISGDRCRLHVERDSARLRQASDDGGV